MSNTDTGQCHLCGDVKPLTFEHIPPQRVFNNKPVSMHTLQSFLIQNKYKKPDLPKTKFRRGMGRQSLCEACNGVTAKWYGDEYAYFVGQAFPYVAKAPRDPVLFVSFKINPLRVIKQVATMCLAATDFAAGYHAGLRRFVLNPTQRGISDHYRFYAYLTAVEEYRMSSFAAVMNVATGSSAMVLAEVAFPPFGFCWTAADPGTVARAAGEGLCDITHFGKWSDGKRIVYLRIPKKHPVGPAPLHYITE